MISLIKTNFSLFLKEAKNSIKIGDALSDSIYKMQIAKKIYDITEQEEMFFLDRLQHEPADLKCGLYALRLSCFLINLGYRPEASEDSQGGIAIEIHNPFRNKKAWFKIYNKDIPKIYLSITDRRDKELVRDKSYISFSYSSPKEWAKITDDLNQNL